MPTSRTAYNDRRDRTTAATVSIILHAVLLVIALTIGLWQIPSDNTATRFPDTPEDPEITFEDVVDFETGGSFTTPADIPQPIQPQQLSQGTQTPAAPVPAPDPQEIQQQVRDEISRRVRFATNNVDQNTGDGGTDEETTAKAIDPDAQSIGLEGFSNEGFPAPRGFSHTGTIAINVTVDASGRVLSTSYNSSRSNGKISTDSQAIKACLTSAAGSKFKPRPGTSEGATGTIYYRFKK